MIMLFGKRLQNSNDFVVQGGTDERIKGMWLGRPSRVRFGPRHDGAGFANH